MPNYTANLTINTGKGALSAVKSGSYDEVVSVTQIVDNTSSFIPILAGSTSKGSATLADCKALIIKNNGISGAEIQLKSYIITDGTPDTTGAIQYNNYFLGAGDYMFLSNLKGVVASADHSAGNAYTLANQVPDANMYVAVNNAAAGDAQLAAEAIDGSETAIDVDEGAYFFVGDIIRVENEVMEVTGVSSNTLTVIRGAYGSTAATHSDDTALRYAFFNAYADFDKYSVSQTDTSGRFKTSNFFGYGRNTDGSGNSESNGIVQGSVSGKFYSAGYQELGMSGVTPSTKTGLVASTAYAFDIAADGGSDHTLAFTTDSSNGNFGGTNGLISKIQAALDEQFYTTSSNLLKKKVTCAIVNGDIRFTSGQHLSGSAISISAPASGTTPFGVGAFNMAVTAIEDAVAARLPNDTVLDRVTGVESPNVGGMFYDDGHGNILGTCTGTINYTTGAMDLQGCPPNAEFVVSANYGSGFSGGNRFSSHDGNAITSIAGRSMNSKLNTTIEIIGLN